MSGPSPAALAHPIAGLACLRCRTTVPVGDYDAGCPACAAEGHASNLRVIYHGDPGPGSIALPFPEAPSLGEGATPELDAPDLADEIGLGRLSLKLEWCNPTGSHKDRMSAQLMARARASGARLVVAASSGNGGLSIAAYAARVGLSAEIAVTDNLSPGFRRALRAHGAVAVTCADSLSRWRHVERRVAEGAFAASNYRLPAVGTNPFGIEGYKTLAVEIAACGAPDVVVVPCARGDLLSGLRLGFAEIGARMPRLIAAEPFPRLSRVMAGADYRERFDGVTAQFSIAGATVTWQAVDALRASGGAAVAVDDAAAGAAQARLGLAGFYAELSAAAAFAALAKLAAEGALAGRSAVVVLTGSGFRDAPQTDSIPVAAAMRSQPEKTGASPSRVDG